MDFSIRQGQVGALGIEGDLELVLATWLRSNKHSGYGTKRIDDKAYYRHQQPLLKAILRRANLSLAVVPDTKDVILGYAVWDTYALHWVYVKKAFRRFGIATRLLADMPTSIVCFSFLNDTDGAHALVRKLPRLVYDPYATTESPCQSP